MAPDSPSLFTDNAEKSRALASALFPEEEWVLKEAGIWVARRPDRGSFICYFEQTGELFSWRYEELKAIIGT